MANLTKKQKENLTRILSNIQRSYNYIEKSQGIAFSIEEKSSNGADYTINNPECINTCSNTVKNIRIMNKNIGSDIAGLEMALNQLQNFLSLEK